jgi:hypothetical protein
LTAGPAVQPRSSHAGISGSPVLLRRCEFALAWLRIMAGVKQFAAKSVQAKQIEDFCAFRRKLGKTQKFRRFRLSAPRPVLARRHRSHYSSGFTN